MSLANAPEARLCLLGEPALIRGDVSLPLGLPARAIVVLAIVAVKWQRPIARNSLAVALWPDIAESDARANVRRYLHLIARVPELAGAIAHTKTHVQWNCEGALSCDVVEFYRATQHAAHYPRAIGFYGDDLCAGYDDAALEPLRADIRSTYVRTLRASFEAARDRGDLAGATLALKRLVAAEPYDEGLARTLVSCCLESGDRIGALREYHALVRRLRDDLDALPEPATAALLPALLGGNERARTANNLVRPADTFLAREAEMQSLVESLAEHRIVAIAGGAGIGKTRLAVETAHVVLDRFAGGVWFVELARSTTLEGALDRIVDAVAAQKNVSPLDALARALHRRDVLLVLDNLEQLSHVEEELIEALLARTPVTLVTTSRRSPANRTRKVLNLSPLTVPPATPSTPDALARFAAVTLFLERASKVAPAMRIDFDNARSLGSIARKLDGVPLAIELVASRANLLTLDGIAKRLDDHLSFSDRNRVDRHVTIDAAIAWSYGLLTEAERCVFRSIAVFGDGWSFDALESVCAEACAGDIAAVASELIESSLVISEQRAGEVRMRAYEATRRYAASRLDEFGEREVRSLRHLGHFTLCAETLAAEFGTSREREAFEQCDRERDNFEVALAWGTQHNVRWAVRLLSALTRYWIARGLANAGARAVAELETRPEIASLDAAQAARFALAAGTLAREAAFSTAGEYLERAIAGFRACGDTRGENEARFSFAAYTLTRGEYADATVQYESCLAAFEALGDENGIASTVVNLAQIAWTRSDYDAAIAYLERAHAGFERTGNGRGIAHAFRSRALIFGALGRHEEAVAQAREAVLLYERLEEPSRVAEALSGLCDAYTDAGRYPDAFGAVLRSFSILRDLEHDVFLMHAMNSLMLACSGIGAHEDVLRIYAIGAERARRIGRNEDGLQDYQNAVARARATLAPALAEAALASGVTLGVDYCIRIARAYAEPASAGDRASDDHRTASTLL